LIYDVPVDDLFSKRFSDSETETRSVSKQESRITSSYLIHKLIQKTCTGRTDLVEF